MHELPLVLFTVLSQIAVGGLLYIHWQDKKENNAPVQVGLGFVTLVALISIIASLFHLGDPLGAYRSIYHLSSSWLSREVLLIGGFFVAVALYLLGQISEAVGRGNAVFGAVACVLGVLGVFSAANIYTLPAYPAWDSPLTMGMFFMTVLAGGLAFGMMCLAHSQASSYTQNNVLIVLLIINAIFAVLFVTGGGEYVQNATMLLGAKIVVGVLLPILLLLMSKKSPSQYINYVFLLVLVGELIGRIMFYDCSVPLGMPNF